MQPSSSETVAVAWRPARDKYDMMFADINLDPMDMDFNW